MSHSRSEGQESISYQALLDKNRILENENESLRARLEEAEELKRAITEGDLDALVIPGPERELVFTLDSADRAYRALVETMNEGTATLGFDGTVLYCNRRFAELLNMPSQSIVGTSIYQFIAPESTVNFNAFLKHKMNTGEINLKAGDGNSLPVYLSISSLKVEGSPNAWCLVVTDLTEQKKNEEIIAAERLASSIIEQAAEIIAVCDTSGRIIRFSNSMPLLCGCDPTFQRFEDLINLQLSEGVDKGKNIFPVSSALKGTTIQGMEAIFESENHQRFYLLLNSGPLKNDDGKVIGCVVTFTDITEHKKTEDALQQAYEELQSQSEELQASNEELQAQSEELQAQTEELQDSYQALSESEKRYHLLFNHSLDAIILTDPRDDGKILSANPAACQMLGWSEKELIGKGRNFLFNPEDPELQALLNERSYSGSAKVQLNYRRKDGSSFIGELSTALFTDVNGEPRSVAIIRDITEKKQAEEALRKQAALIDLSPDGIIVRKLDGEITFWSNGAEAMYGWTEQEALGQQTHSLFKTVFPHPLEDIVRKLLQTGRWFGELVHTTKDGLQLVVQSHWLLQFDDKGCGTDILESNVNITEHKRAEEALLDSNQKINVILESIQDDFYVLDRDWKFDYASKNFTSRIGKKPKDFVGNNIWEMFPNHLGTILEENYRVAMEKREIREFELHGQYTDAWYRMKVYPSAEGITILGTDVTERKKAEEALRESELKYRTLSNTLEEKVKERTEELEKAYKSLKESEERFRISVKNTRFVLSQFDSNLRYTWIYNPHPDFDASSLIGKRGDEQKYSDEMRRFVALKRQVLESGKGIREEISFNRSDGVHTYDTIIEPIYNDIGYIIGGTVSALDITERKKAEDALAKIDIARKQEIHHRIKNNLQVISSLLDLQAEQFRGRKSIKDSEVLAAFRESQDRVISMALIHEELYKGGGFATLNFTPYIKELAENLLQTYSLRNTNISLKLDLAENAFLDMDIAVPLGMIVNELVSNSFKHAFKGRDEGEIQISLCREEYSELESEDCEISNFVLTVSDNGIGIPENLDIEDIDTLGMQLVTSLVDQLDGSFELKRNNGTEFTMRFTVKEDNHSASVQAPQLIE
jgi:PAS domain S-box-containing protein